MSAILIVKYFQEKSAVSIWFLTNLWYYQDGDNQEMQLLINTLSQKSTLVAFKVKVLKSVQIIKNTYKKWKKNRFLAFIVTIWSYFNSFFKWITALEQ